MYQLEGNPSLTPFYDRFENQLAGWTINYGHINLQRYIYLLMAQKIYTEVLNKYADYVVATSKSNLTKDKKGGGALYNSIRI